jgi:hypothetical protein
MEFRTQDVAMDRRTEAQYIGNGTGGVLPVPFSHKDNSVGVHWLRISFPDKYLAHVSAFVSNFFGCFDQDGFGLWSYTDRFAWESGVSLNYDQDRDRSDHVHAGMMTLDCPGSSLDLLSAPDLQLLLELCNNFEGKCTRIDVYFDDYNRLVTPSEVYEIAKKDDYSGFRSYGYRERGNSTGVTYEEVSFGRRGSYGNGAYLRFYDKNLESNGKQNCCRWEVEFTQKKAVKVFKKLTETGGDLDAFATLCGSLVAGCITFVHRTGDKNISRLEQYDWWSAILEVLGGQVRIRVERKKDSVTGKMDWIKRNVSPSLACLKRVFSTERDFFRWLFDVTREGDSRMNPRSEQIAKENAGCFTYRWSNLQRECEVEYDKSMSQL